MVAGLEHPQRTELGLQVAVFQLHERDGIGQRGLHRRFFVRGARLKEQQVLGAR